MAEDPRADAARSIPIAEVADRLAIPGLKRASAQEQVGPCPVCGGRDRFSVNRARGVWNCRHCGGGDGIGLVRHVLGCDFRAAVGWLVGEADVGLDPEEARRREAARAKAKAESDRRAEVERGKAVAAAREIWAQGRPIGGTPVADYLVRRGLPAAVAARDFPALRFHPDLGFTVPAAGGGWDVIHRGPAMLAACQSPGGDLVAVHRTWLDLSRPKGKAVIIHNGEEQPAKKILGAKKGAAIRLTHQRAWPRILVMGEGIETTLTALAADLWPEAGYWAGIDLGNMSGARILRGEGMKHAGVPDLSDGEAFRPPPGIGTLIYLQDGDSEPKSTRAKLVAGLRRARHFAPDLRIAIAHAGEGRDFNDILLGAQE